MLFLCTTGTVSRQVILLDGGLFTALLLMYKLALYKLYVVFFQQKSLGLGRRLVCALLVLAPTSTAVGATAAGTGPAPGPGRACRCTCACSSPPPRSGP